MNPFNLFEKFTSYVKNVNNGKFSFLLSVRYGICGIFDYLIFGSTITDYFELTFHKKSFREKCKYATWRFHKKFIFQVDNREIINQLSDKGFMYKELAPYIRRNILNTKDCSISEFRSFINKSPIFMFKPFDGSCGEGIRKIDCSKTDENLECLFNNLRNGILDELIIQHSHITELNPSCVNTVRIFTLRTNNSIYFTGSSFRIGTKGIIDNYSAGGIATSIDLQSGRIVDRGEDIYGNRYDKHPVTGVTLTGFELPNWSIVIDYVFLLAQNYKLNYVAWDIAITEDGCDLVEANPCGMINVIQIAGGKGKLDLYKKLQQEIINYPYKGNNNELQKVIC